MLGSVSLHKKRNPASNRRARPRRLCGTDNASLLAASRNSRRKRLRNRPNSGSARGSPRHLAPSHGGKGAALGGVPKGGRAIGLVAPVTSDSDTQESRELVLSCGVQRGVWYPGRMSVAAPGVERQACWGTGGCAPRGPTRAAPPTELGQAAHTQAFSGSVRKHSHWGHKRPSKEQRGVAEKSQKRARERSEEG
eukprot:569621-Prorocentrum_minimum.AAC.1